MATSASPVRRPARSKLIPVRKIGVDDLRVALRLGLADFQEMRGDIVLGGLIYTMVGIAAVVMTSSGPLMPFFLPVVAGVGLFGPAAAIGFYELARRREQGEHGNWSHFFDFRKRPAAGDMGLVATLLLLIFFAWLLAAGTLYAIIFGWTAPDTLTQFVAMVFTTPRGWALIVSGLVVGAIFGWIVLAISVASLPMLVDCDVSAAQAVSTSWRAAHANKALMLRWGLTVAALLVLGSIPLFVGLAIVLPWLGYATWHLYTRLVDRDSIPARTRRKA
jgi:uncharacterized membrane protein